MVDLEAAASGLEDDWLVSDQSSPSNRGVVYLNNASQARLSQAAKDAGIHALSSCPVLPCADEDQRRVRQLFAQLIGATEADVAIHPSTAFAITSAAENVLRDVVVDEQEEDDREKAKEEEENGVTTAATRRRIVVLEDQMCSAVYPWQDIIRRSRGRLVLDIVPFPSLPESTWTDSVLERLLDGSAAACCLPPLHWSDGSLIDLVRISEECRKHCTQLIVDATQAIGAMECDVRILQPALLACSTHKWLRSCPGASLVYVHPRVRDRWQPLDQHGRGRDLGSPSWDAGKEEMTPEGYPTAFYRDARKFDAGGKPNPVLLPVLRVALEEVAALDVREVQGQLKVLLAPFVEWAANHGYQFPSSHAYHLVGIRPDPPVSAERMISVASKLESSHGVVIAVRCGAFRISPYLDSTESDIFRLVEALERETSDLTGL